VWLFGHENSPISSCIRFPDLSGRPAIFHVFFGDETIAPHFGHFAIQFPP